MAALLGLPVKWSERSSGLQLTGAFGLTDESVVPKTLVANISMS
jgi:hypothetical protein